MSRKTNDGVMIRYKKITANLLTIVRLLVEPITSLEKTKDSLEAYLSISEPPWTVTSSKPVISPSLSRFFSFGSMLISNRYLWSTVLSYVGNSDGRCGGRNTTGKTKCTASGNFISTTNLINGGGMFFDKVPLSFEKGLLNQYWASHSKNSLITINFSLWSILTL